MTDRQIYIERDALERRTDCIKRASVWNSGFTWRRKTRRLYSFCGRQARQCSSFTASLPQRGKISRHGGNSRRRGMASVLNINRLYEVIPVHAIVYERRQGDAIHFRSGSEIQPRFFNRKLSKSGSGRIDLSESKSLRCIASNDFLPTRLDGTKRFCSGFRDRSSARSWAMKNHANARSSLH